MKHNRRSLKSPPDHSDLSVVISVKSRLCDRSPARSRPWTGTMSANGGGFNRSPQHILRTSPLAFGIARSCAAAHWASARWRSPLPGN